MVSPTLLDYVAHLDGSNQVLVALLVFPPKQLQTRIHHFSHIDALYHKQQFQESI